MATTYSRIPGAKDFRVASELATDISRALRLADEGHEIVLPNLRNLHVLQPVSTGGPLWDSVESFVTQRQLSGLPVQSICAATFARGTYISCHVVPAAAAITATTAAFRWGIDTYDHAATAATGVCLAITFLSPPFPCIRLK
jgi:hypothetical protein